MFWKINKRLKALHCVLADIALYEKAQTLIKDGVFFFQFEDEVIKLYLPDATRDLVQKTIFSTDAFFEQALLQKMRKHIRPGSVVVDAGTNIGNHTVFFSKVCGAREIHSFEPLKSVFAILQRNLELNGITNVVAHNVALGEACGTASISGFANMSVGSTQFGMSAGGAFQVVTLDSLQLPKIDFCKIDVEGMQLEMLKGARQTLLASKPMIWIEMLDKANAMFGYDEDHEVRKPMELLADMGYLLVEKMSAYDYLYVHESASAGVAP